MAQLQAGTIYSAEDNTVTVANLNSHVSAAILLDDAVSAQTALGAAPASDDVVLISDTDAATLKKATTTELLGTELAAWVGKGASGGTAALQIDGVDKLSVDSSGNTTAAGTLTASSTLAVTGVTTLADHLNLLTNKEMRLQDAADNEYVGMKAPATVSGSYTMTMPAAVGASGEVLQASDAAGTLGWASVATGVASSQGVATSTALGSSLTDVGTATLTLPAGKTWIWLKLVFSTKLNTNGGISGLTIKLEDTDSMSWVGITTAITTANSESDTMMVSYVQEGAPGATYEGTTSLDLVAYSQDEDSKVDEPAFRQLYAIGTYA